MKFDWNGFTANDFVNYCARVENDMIGQDDYVGCVRVGNLCFDLLVRQYGDIQCLSFDLYVGGVDTGYGYADMKKAIDMYNGISDNSEKDPQYPYDYADGEDFEDTMISMVYEDFQKYAEERFEKYIKSCQYNEASLIEKANEPLHIW